MRPLTPTSASDDLNDKTLILFSGFSSLCRSGIVRFTSSFICLQGDDMDDSELSATESKSSEYETGSSEYEYEKAPTTTST